VLSAALLDNFILEYSILKDDVKHKSPLLPWRGLVSISLRYYNVGDRIDEDILSKD
jgi:hypothetical protein